MKFYAHLIIRDFVGARRESHNIRYKERSQAMLGYVANPLLERCKQALNDPMSCLGKLKYISSWLLPCVVCFLQVMLARGKHALHWEERLELHVLRMARDVSRMFPTLGSDPDPARNTGSNLGSPLHGVAERTRTRECQTETGNVRART